MMIILLPISFLIIMIIFFILFLTISKKQETTLKTMDKEGKIKSSAMQEQTKNKKNENNGDKKDAMKKVDVFKFMEFDRILDNMIVQNNGSRFTMAIKCKGINYDLMSEVEQMSVEEGFITFLNTLKYPIQFYVQAQNIDLKSVIQKYRQNTAEISQKYDDINKEYTKLASTFDVDEKRLDKVTKERDSITNVYEYAEDMISYVEKMSTNKNLLERNFYVLVSYSTGDISSVDKFSKEEIIEMCNTELNTRCNAIISGLSSCSVTGNILTSNELADLLYSAYNRDDRGLVSVQEALDAGIFRLYSTSEDAIYKRTVALDDYLNAQARIKALESIKYVLEHDEISTPASNAIDEEEEISKRATNMVKAEDFDQDLKNDVNKKILQDFRETKKELLEIDKEQKESFKQQAKEDLKELEELKKVEVPNGIKLIEKSKQNIVEEKENNEDTNVEKNEVTQEVPQETTKTNVEPETSNSLEDNTNLYDNTTSEEDESII